LKIDDRDFGGWISVRVTRSLEEVAASFDLGVTDWWPGADERRPLTPHQACTLTIDDAPVISGVIDSVAPRYDAGNHVVQVRGRSLTGQLVDCACEHPSGALRDLTLVEIATRIAEPFGIAVVDLAGETKPFPRVQVEPGETVFELLERLARQRGVFLTDDTRGRLVIRRRSETLQGTLEYGSNVLSAAANLDGSNQFSNYRVKGQAEGSDNTGAGTSASSAGRAVDASVPIHRPMILLAESQGTTVTMGQRAKHEAALRRARARTWTYTVQGWAPDALGLWQAGEEVEVTDPLMGLNKDRLLVVETTFSLDHRGTVTELKVAPPEGYDLLAEETLQRVSSKSTQTGWDAL
ncbi:MAG: phage baseplate assembly protein, partial [Pseudomonadota bacterium]